MSRFPPHRGGDALADMVSRLGGQASVPTYEPCTVCLRMVYVSALHAHAACLAGRGVDPADLGHVVVAPDRPAPIVGTVYASITADSHADRVSARRAAEIEAEGRATVDGAPKCGVCGGPMTVGQRGTHRECKESNITDHGRLH